MHMLRNTITVWNLLLTLNGAGLDLDSKAIRPNCAMKFRRLRELQELRPTTKGGKGAVAHCSRVDTDDMVLETAVNGRADLLVTFNQEDFVVAAKAFVRDVIPPHEIGAPCGRALPRR
jgi:hypothetical protein